MRRLALAGFPCVVLEDPEPSTVRRTVAFANALYESAWTVEGVTAISCSNVEEVWHALHGRPVDRATVAEFAARPDGDRRKNEDRRRGGDRRGSHRRGAVDLPPPVVAAPSTEGPHPVRYAVVEPTPLPVPVLVDPHGATLADLRPQIFVEGRMAKRNHGLRSTAWPLVIAIGPGFTAPRDAHFVIETCRGHDLGRVIAKGHSAPDTGRPGEIAGESDSRVLRAPSDGRFWTARVIGMPVHTGNVIGYVCAEGFHPGATGPDFGAPVTTTIDGVVRGLLRDGHRVREGQKVGDVDPRNDPAYCERISDRANAVAGGVLEAVLRGLRAGT
ncbi:MAG: hypothetical protein HYY93_00370 [Planctomycetes bacterium]|nr:hypothetical protein [Planctomycetota bacterium]